MQSKLKTFSDNRQTQAAKNFSFWKPAALPAFDSPFKTFSIFRLAEIYRKAEATGNELQQQRVLMEIDSREPLYGFNYFNLFVEVYSQIEQHQAMEAQRA